MSDTMRAAAEAALLSGEWRLYRPHRDIADSVCDDSGHVATFEREVDAAHIVASQPRAVLALLDERDALLAEVERLRSAIGLLPMSRGELAARNDALREAAQALIDKMDFKIDHEKPPFKFTAPWAEATALRDALS